MKGDYLGIKPPFDQQKSLKNDIQAYQSVVKIKINNKQSLFDKLKGQVIRVWSFLLNQGSLLSEKLKSPNKVGDFRKSDWKSIDFLVNFSSLFLNVNKGKGR